LGKESPPILKRKARTETKMSYLNGGGRHMGGGGGCVLKDQNLGVGRAKGGENHKNSGSAGGNHPKEGGDTPWGKLEGKKKEKIKLNKKKKNKKKHFACPKKRKSLFFRLGSKGPFFKVILPHSRLSRAFLKRWIPRGSDF